MVVFYDTCEDKVVMQNIATKTQNCTKKVIAVKTQNSQMETVDYYL